ncbi:MAG: efflux RND transporter permease subunit [bacterium]
MRLPALSVRRPVATSMLFLAATLLGVVSLARLEVSLLPDLRSEAVRIWIGWPTAGVPEIEEAVARPAEDAVLSAPGVRRVRSRVVSGGVALTAELHRGVDPALTLVGLRERLDAVRWTFPPDVERPLVLGGAGEESPALVFAIAAPEAAAIADWAEKILVPRLEQLDGVARALVVGAPKPEITVSLDEERLRAAGLDVSDVARSIRSASVATSGGALRRSGLRFPVRVESELATAADVAGVTLSRAGGPALALRDVARVEEGEAAPEGWVRLDGEPAVGVLVWRQAGRNLLDVSRRAREEVELLAAEFPAVHVEVVADSSPFVRRAVTGVGQSAALGGLLAFGVLFAFLRDARSPLRLFLALPVSLVVTFLVLDFAGVSLNLMSLGGLALGVGMLVDNGIVCLENVDRLRRDGVPAAVAAVQGAGQIAWPVLASTLTTCAVFVPLAFVPGALGALCRDLAIAVSVSLLVSWIVSLTLLPLLASRDAGALEERPRTPGLAAHHVALDFALRRPTLTLAVVAGLVLASGLVIARLPREMLPPVATGHLEFDLSLPAGVDASATDGFARALEERVAILPGVESVFTTAGDTGSIDPGDDARRPNHGTLRVRLARPDAKVRRHVVDALAATAEDWPGAAIVEIPDAPELATLLSGGAATLTLDVADPDERRGEEIAHAIAARATSMLPAATFPLTVVAAEREPRLRLRPRPEALWRLGLTEDDLLAAVEALTSGHTATRLTRFDEEVPVVLHAPADDPFRAAVAVGARTVPLSELVDVVTEQAPATRLREDQARVASIRWNGPLREADQVRRALEAAAAGTTFPSGVTWRFGGAWREMRQTLAGLGRALALSTGLVLLILAAQFESVRLPLLVLAAVPLALPGVALALWATNSSLSAMAAIGGIVLVGIAVNDAILEVDLFRRYTDEGLSAEDAVRLASERRFRPIVMTTLTTVLGLVPLWFGTGAELRAPLAAVAAGGLASATGLTLLVLPVLFVRLGGSKR